MSHHLAADLVMVVHFLFVLFVLLGGILVWRWPGVAWFHAPAFVWGFTVSAMGWICPLTPLEQRLRQAVDDTVYEGGFVAHYIEPLLYPEGLSWGLRMSIATLLLLLNVALYWHAWYRRRAEKTGHRLGAG